MAGLFDKQAEIYLDARPNYPKEWFTLLSDRTSYHSLAWDVGTGNGQAAVSVAKHYDQVIGTDVSEAQLKCAIPHPQVRYLHTPISISDEDLISQLGGENSVDLITVAQAVHWFNLPSFYSIAARVLRKPGGVIAVWCYNDIVVDPNFDVIFKRFHGTTLPYWNPGIQLLFDGYKTLPFPFEAVGLSCEGEPLKLDIKKELSFEGFLRMVRSWSAVVMAKEQGVDLLPESVVGELEVAWGGLTLVRSVVYKAFMLAGSVKL
ncbi:hypothetical protein SAY87_026240 [Trapa incisa]|uniref:Methyltransferase type 11 domain-containing protein n=2 Tax=Trapa TaxID=22665 RepID=A0AAN7QZZ5_TRANT|nr:hypothetical protein SAY87_026240 [Trapa incisa]KAK4785282.1 hypothetical protein SAY86_001971 [Trapa natans]